MLENIILKPKLEGYLELGIPHKYKKVRAVYIAEHEGKIESLDGELIYYGTMSYNRHFYDPSSVNIEVMNLIENGTVLKSINAVTVDGKVIQIESTE